MVLVMDEETVLKRLELDRDVSLWRNVLNAPLLGRSLRFQHQQAAPEICLLFIAYPRYLDNIYVSIRR
jgi:hypothetical protein